MLTIEIDGPCGYRTRFHSKDYRMSAIVELVRLFRSRSVATEEIDVAVGQTVADVKGIALVKLIIALNRINEAEIISGVLKRR